MVWAQWGLKERLVNNADVWLCHQCADCTAKCPRDAKPGEVLGAIRRTAYRAHAVPGFMGTLFSDLKFLPVVFAIPVLVLWAVIALNQSAGLGQGFFPAPGVAPDPPIRFSWMVPIVTGVDATFLTVAFLAVLSSLVSLRRFWANLEAQVPASVPRKGFVPSLAEFVGEILSHASFKKCTVNAGRTLAHLLVFYGFVGAFIATNIVLVYEWGTKFGFFHLETPLHFSGAGLIPKLFGNVGGLAIMAGALLMIGNRMAKSEDSPASGYDWVFLFSIFLVGATGMLTEALRLLGDAGLAYPMYFIHLVFVFYVIAFLPYSKLAHLLYRPLAIIHAKNVGRDTPAAAPKAA
jgi:quinone-modifying oxidoreductase subunit QmoC